ncbi:MAG TPA: hypothetical protein P5511_01615, partial [Candidatus Goldiibacteriota bacterium]|nr:hypothetical protein [Candidatus Goldiibacteriota bacterium]
GNDIDADAGAKLALRYTSGANTYQYGNPGTNYTTTVTRNFAHVRTQYYYLLTTPWGETESVISTVFQTTKTNGTEIPMYVNKKTIIRGNKKWFATIYYIRNNHATRNAVNTRFFQGCDWNFNGSNNGDDCAYDGAKDTVFGYKSAGNPVSYGGFSGFTASLSHHVGTYITMWQAIVNANLNNLNSVNGDAGTALEFLVGNGSLPAGSSGAVEIIWGYGNTLNGQAQADMQAEIDYGKARLHDTGILEITSPAEGRVFRNSDGYIMISATAVNYGLRDWSTVPVKIDITGPAGFTPVTGFTYANVTFTVPTAESVIAGYGFDISNTAAVPPGLYTIRVYTDLSSIPGITDQNPGNDSKTVNVYIGGVSVNPETRQVVSAGSYGDIALTCGNTTGTNYRFNISPDSSSMGWPTSVLNQSDSALLAADYDGDLVWDYVNPAYDTDSDSRPDILINNNSSYGIIFRKYVPETAEGGETDITSVRLAAVSAPSVYGTALETTVASYKSAVNKTLWLHANAEGPAEHAYNLTTLTDTAAADTSSTLVNRYASRAFSMSPPLYRQLRLVNAINARLVLVRGGTVGTVNATVDIFYTNGVNTVKIGSSTVACNTGTYNFPITLAGPVTIPAGYKLAMLFTNVGNTARTLTIQHTGSVAPDQRSCVSLDVTDYVGVDWIRSFDSEGNTKSVLAAGSQARISAQMSDPFGSYDVNTTNARITIIDALNNTVLSSAALTYEAEDTGNPKGWKRMYITYNIPEAAEPGIWAAVVTAVEGNGASSSRVYKFTVSRPDHVRVSPVFTALPAGWQASLGIQVVDINGNSMAAQRWVTVTANADASFSAVPPGWAGLGLNTAYGFTDNAGFAAVSVSNSAAQQVTITPSALLAGSPARDEKAYVWFTSADHASARVDDGIAAAGAAGTGEPVRIWLEDFAGNTVASVQWVTVTASGSAYFSYVPSGWTIAGGNTAYGPTNPSGYADLVLKNNSTGTAVVTPFSTPWGNHSRDVTASVMFVAPGADHVALSYAGSGTLSAGTQKSLVVSVVDADKVPVTGNYTVVINAPQKATFTASSDPSASGIGTGTLVMEITGASSGTADIIDYYAQSLTVTPHCAALAGSNASPDRDVPVVLEWVAGPADHVAAFAASEYTEIGTTVEIRLQVVDVYGNSVSGATTISLSSSGAAIFTSSTLAAVTGINTGNISGTTNLSGFATAHIYNETAQTNNIIPDSGLDGSIAAPDRDVGT